MKKITPTNQNQESATEKGFLVCKRMAWLFLAVSILLLLYTFYRSTIFYQDRMEGLFFKYYIISLVGIVFWSVVLKLSNQVRTNIVMVSTCLLIGLYLAEGVINFSGISLAPVGRQTLPELAKVAAKLGIEFDVRTKFQVLQDLRAQGVDATVAIRPKSFLGTGGLHQEGAELLFPLGGISEKTTVLCNESGKYLVYPADRHGFNNPDSEWDSAPVGWLLTGDSFTHGSCVQPGNDIAGQIRSITGDSVINLGQGGNGPLIELAALKEYAELVRPKKVIWVYFEGNDLRDLRKYKNIPLLMQYLQNEFSQDLIHRQKEIDRRLGKYLLDAEAAVILYKTRWMRLSSVRRLLKFDDTIDSDEKNINSAVNIDPLFTKILKEGRDRTKAWGGQLYFAYLPTYHRYATDTVNHNLYFNRSGVIDVVKALNIPIIDLHQEVFASHPDPLSLYPLRTPGHYSAKGYAEVAKSIVKGVKQRIVEED